MLQFFGFNVLEHQLISHKEYKLLDSITNNQCCFFLKYLIPNNFDGVKMCLIHSDFHILNYLTKISYICLAYENIINECLLG
jgi:hypothetical protein